MALNGMAQYGALALGAPVGFWLYEARGFASVSACTAVMPLLALAVVLPLSPVAASGRRDLPLGDVVRRIAGPGIGLLLAGIGFANVSTFASLAFAERGWPGAGYALTAFGGCFIGVRIFAGRSPDRFGGLRVAALSMMTETIGQALMWAAPSPAVALVGAALTGAGCSLVFPSLGVEALKRVPPEQRGVTIGVFAAFQDIAIGATGPTLGAIATGAGMMSVFLVGAVAAMVGVLATARSRGATGVASRDGLARCPKRSAGSRTGLEGPSS